MYMKNKTNVINELKLKNYKKRCLTMELSKFRKEKWIVHPVRSLCNEK